MTPPLPATSAAAPAGRPRVALIILAALAIVAGLIAVLAHRTGPAETDDASPIRSTLAPVFPLPTPSLPAPTSDDCTPPVNVVPPVVQPFDPTAVLVPPGAVNIPPCSTRSLGSEATFTLETGEQMAIAVTVGEDARQRRFPLKVPKGQHRVSFRLHIRNLATTRLETDLGHSLWAADQDDIWMFPAPMLFSSIILEPNQETDRYVAFDVGARTRLSRLRLSTQEGNIARTVDWAVS